jgi:hypothetical protein
MDHQPNKTKQEASNKPKELSIEKGKDGRRIHPTMSIETLKENVTNEAEVSYLVLEWWLFPNQSGCKTLTSYWK